MRALVQMRILLSIGMFIIGLVAGYEPMTDFLRPLGAFAPIGGALSAFFGAIMLAASVYEWMGRRK